MRKGSPRFGCRGAGAGPASPRRTLPRLQGRERSPFWEPAPTPRRIDDRRTDRNQHDRQQALKTTTVCRFIFPDPEKTIGNSLGSLKARGRARHSSFHTYSMRPHVRSGLPLSVAGLNLHRLRRSCGLVGAGAGCAFDLAVEHSAVHVDQEVRRTIPFRSLAAPLAGYAASRRCSRPPPPVSRPSSLVTA